VTAVDDEWRTLIERPAWMDDANCRGFDVDKFFPVSGEDTRTIKAICRACDVQAECLAYAINNHEIHGIWGGLSERERRRIRRSRRIAVVAS